MVCCVRTSREVVDGVFRDNFHIRLKYVDGSRKFLRRVRAISDPERKRKVIGNEFIRVFDDAVTETDQTQERREIPGFIQMAGARHALSGCD